MFLNKKLLRGLAVVSALGALVLFGPLGCGDDESTDPPTGVLSYEVDGAWDCATSESCQDVYELDLPAGATLTVRVTAVTGASVPRLAVHEPGVDLGGINLLTGTTQDRECVGQNQGDEVSVAVGEEGVYMIVVSRDWGSSAGAAGTYHLTVAADLRFMVEGQPVQDENSLASGSRCGYSISGFDSWACDTGETCQDVYEIDLAAGQTVTVAVTDITGASVPRLALFAPGVPLNGTNLFTGSNNDRECVGQNEEDSASATATVTGTYRFVIGRDWGSSAGADGTYSFTVSADDPFGFGDLQDDDITSLAAGSLCPGK